ncbi:MAG: hypothetical protein DME26_04550, partial [Verrucomicrobia bacterium]
RDADSDDTAFERSFGGGHRLAVRFRQPLLGVGEPGRVHDLWRTAHCDFIDRSGGNLRPEAYAGRVHNHVIGAAQYPLGSDVLDSPALPLVHSQYGTYLLPQVYPEGSPLHPSYGSGHGTVAGACVTILKAWFDENYVIPNPVVASSDGLSLLPYSGPPLTVGGELNKIASNVAFGRNIAGIHWRADAIEAMKLGEAVAISILRDQKACYNEDFGGFTFTKFDGTTITV